MMKMFNAATQEEELATYLNRRGFRLDSVSMFITESGFCGVQVRRKKVEFDPYEEEPQKKFYRRIAVFRLEDGENARIDEIYEKSSIRELRVVSEISKGTEEGYLVMIDYEEKLK